MEIDLVLADEYAVNFLDTKGPPGSGDRLRHLAKAVYAEVQQGGSIEKTLQIVVARKPYHFTNREEGMLKQ